MSNPFNEKLTVTVGFFVGQTVVKLSNFPLYINFTVIHHAILFIKQNHMSIY